MLGSESLSLIRSLVMSFYSFVGNKSLVMGDVKIELDSGEELSASLPILILF